LAAYFAKILCWSNCEQPLRQELWTVAREPSSGYQIIHALKSSCSLDWQAIFKKGLATGAWAKELVFVRSLKKQFLSEIYG
jgi:hypothetical protein